MPVPVAKLMVAVEEAGVCLRVAGKANFACSAEFKKAVETLRARGHTRFLIDLTECSTMDSTFIGVLAGFARRLRSVQTQTAPVELAHASERIRQQIDNLGVLPLFKLSGTAPPEASYQSLPPIPASKQELSRLSLEAHRTLMELHPGNVPRFQDVTQFLAEELAQTSPPKPASPPTPPTTAD